MNMFKWDDRTYFVGPIYTHIPTYYICVEYNKMSHLRAPTLTKPNNTEESTAGAPSTRGLKRYAMLILSSKDSRKWLMVYCTVYTYTE